MGVLERGEQGVRYPLVSRTLVGRSRACLVRLSSPRVSSAHAELSWDGESWFVRDLGSRNGTYLAGELLDPRRRVKISEGSELVFGSKTECFVLTDDGCPSLVAQSMEGRIASATTAVLCLPSEDEPEVTILRDAKGGWCCETEQGTEAFEDQAVVDAGGTHWRVHLPDARDDTQSGDEAPLSTALMGLEIKVSRDEEHVEITVDHGTRTIALPSRAHDFILLNLARSRLGDQAQGVEIESAEHGWVYRQDLMRGLKIERHRLNLWIHRLRRQFAEIGLVDTSNLIERRPHSEQLRLGVARLRVSRM